MQNKYFRALGWAAAVFFFLFGSLILAGTIAAGNSPARDWPFWGVMYAAAYFSWKYVARKPKQQEKPAA